MPAPRRSRCVVWLADGSLLVAAGAQVAAERLDQELRLGQRNQIDWIKIDVEGSELEALCGATEWLARGAIANLGMELNWKTTIQSQVRTVSVTIGRG